MHDDAPELFNQLWFCASDSAPLLRIGRVADHTRCVGEQGTVWVCQTCHGQWWSSDDASICEPYTQSDDYAPSVDTFSIIHLDGASIRIEGISPHR